MTTMDLRGLKNSTIQSEYECSSYTTTTGSSDIDYKDIAEEQERIADSIKREKQITQWNKTFRDGYKQPSKPHKVASHKEFSMRRV